LAGFEGPMAGAGAFTQLKRNWSSATGLLLCHWGHVPSTHTCAASAMTSAVIHALRLGPVLTRMVLTRPVTQVVRQLRRQVL
jgi:hypothetical protein